MVRLLLVLIFISMSRTAARHVHKEPLHKLVEGDVVIVRGVIGDEIAADVRLCAEKDCRLSDHLWIKGFASAILDSVHATENGTRIKSQEIYFDKELEIGEELSVKITAHKRGIQFHFSNNSKFLKTPFPGWLNHDIFLKVRNLRELRVLDKRSSEVLYAEHLPKLDDGDILSVRGKIDSVEFFLFYIDLCSTKDCTEMPLRIRISTHATSLYAVKNVEFNETSTFPTEFQSGQEFAVDIEVHEAALKIRFGKDKEFHNFPLSVDKVDITYYRVSQFDGISFVSPLGNVLANDEVDPVYSFSVRKMNLEDEFVINGTFFYGSNTRFNISLCPSPSCSEMELIIRVEEEIAYIDTFLTNPDAWLNSQSVPTICRVGKPFGITIRMEEYIYRNLFYNMDSGTKQNTHLQYNYYNRTTYMEIRAAPSPSVLKRDTDMPKRVNFTVKYNPGPQVGPEDTDKDYFGADPNAVVEEDQYETTTLPPKTEEPETTEEEPEEEDHTTEFILYGIGAVVYGLLLNVANL